MIRFSARKARKCFALLDADDHEQPVLASRRDRHHVRSGVGRLYADHAAVLFVAEIRQAPRFIDPRIPDDGREAAGLRDSDTAIETRVFDHAGRGRVDVDTVGLRGDRDWPALDFALVAIDLVDICAAIQPLDPDRAGITDVKVAVERAAAGERRVASVAYDQLGAQLRADGDHDLEPERVRPEVIGRLVVGDAEPELGRAVERGGRANIPHRRPYEAMARLGRVGRVWPKPRPADRDAAANRFAWLVQAVPTDPQHRRFPMRLETDH